MDLDSVFQMFQSVVSRCIDLSEAETSWQRELLNTAAEKQRQRKRVINKRARDKIQFSMS